MKLTADIIKNQKQTVLMGGVCLLLGVITVVLMRHEPAVEVAEKNETIETEIQRVDISHTFKTFDDGVYQIYLGQISLLQGQDGTLHIEYPQGRILPVESKLESIDESYDITGTASVISQLDLANDCAMKISGVVSDMVHITNEWHDTRIKCIDNSELLLDMVLQFEQKDGVVVALEIKEYESIAEENIEENIE